LEHVYTLIKKGCDQSKTSYVAFARKDLREARKTVRRHVSAHKNNLYGSEGIVATLQEELRKRPATSDLERLETENRRLLRESQDLRRQGDQSVPRTTYVQTLEHKTFLENNLELLKAQLAENARDLTRCKQSEETLSQRNEALSDELLLIKRDKAKLESQNDKDSKHLAYLEEKLLIAETRVTTPQAGDQARQLSRANASLTKAEKELGEALKAAAAWKTDSLKLREDIKTWKEAARTLDKDIKGPSDLKDNIEDLREGDQALLRSKDQAIDSLNTQIVQLKEDLEDSKQLVRDTELNAQEHIVSQKEQLLLEQGIARSEHVRIQTELKAKETELTQLKDDLEDEKAHGRYVEGQLQFLKSRAGKQDEQSQQIEDLRESLQEAVNKLTDTRTLLLQYFPELGEVSNERLSTFLPQILKTVRGDDIRPLFLEWKLQPPRLRKDFATLIQAHVAQLQQQLSECLRHKDAHKADIERLQTQLKTRS
jgi:chromosome segregation ATPase